MANTLATIGYYLVLIGGIIVLIFGLLGLFGSALLIFSPLALIGGIFSSLVQIVVGVICIIGSKYVSTLIWAIILLVLGIIAGVGGGLVILGAILGILSTLIKT